MINNFDALLVAFMERLEKEQNERVAKTFPGLQARALAEGRRGYEQVGQSEGGKRFVRVWSESGQKMVKYFVEKETGIIFGAKGWKAYNPNHQYGTLETITEWDWSDYYGKNKKGLSSLVPKSERK